MFFMSCGTMDSRFGMRGLLPLQHVASIRLFPSFLLVSLVTFPVKCSAKEDPVMIPRSMSHVAFCVTDFDRSLHFYRDLLGFQVAQEGTESEVNEHQQGIYERLNRKFRFVTLRYGQSNATPFGMNEDAPIVVLIAPMDAPPTGR